MRRALLLCLVGAALTLLAASRTWTSRVVDHGPTLPLTTITRTGQELAPGLRPLALVGLAAVLALLATRSVGRRLVGLLVVGCGAGIAALAVTEPGTTSSWPLAALAGGCLLVAGGGMALVNGHRWGGLSDAYRTPAARAETAPVTDKGVWDALDRGEDPTADPHG